MFMFLISAVLVLQNLISMAKYPKTSQLQIQFVLVWIKQRLTVSVTGGKIQVIQGFISKSCFYVKNTFCLVLGRRTSYSRHSWRLWTFWFHRSGRWHKARSGPVTLTDCIYSGRSEYASAASLPRASSSPVFFKDFAVSCFPGNFKATLPQTVPGKDRQQGNMTEGCSPSDTLSLTHTHVRALSPCSPGEKTQAWHLCLRGSHIYLVADAVCTVLF